MKNTKEIRVTFNDASAQEAVRRLMILSVLKGEDFQGTLASAIRSFLDSPAHLEILADGTWLSQIELIKRLKKEKVSTNPQTLLNYRNAGHLDGFYCSDGAKRIFYLYEKVKTVLQNPPVRRKQGKVAVLGEAEN